MTNQTRQSEGSSCTKTFASKVRLSILLLLARLRLKPLLLENLLPKLRHMKHDRRRHQHRWKLNKTAPSLNLVLFQKNLPNKRTSPLA